MDTRIHRIIAQASPPVELSARTMPLSALDLWAELQILEQERRACRAWFVIFSPKNRRSSQEDHAKRFLTRV